MRRLLYLLLHPVQLSSGQGDQLCGALEQLGQREILPLEEVICPDRCALDEVVFDVLGLTQGEREAVYEAVVALVRARLEKARSM